MAFKDSWATVEYAFYTTPRQRGSTSKSSLVVVVAVVLLGLLTAARLEIDIDVFWYDNREIPSVGPDASVTLTGRSSRDPTLAGSTVINGPETAAEPTTRELRLDQANRQSSELSPKPGVTPLQHRELHAKSRERDQNADPEVESDASNVNAESNETTESDLSNEVEAVIASLENVFVEQASAIGQELELQIKANPDARDAAMQAYLSDPDSPVSDTLLELISSSNDPVVESMAVNAAYSGVTASERIAGLKVLSRLQNPSVQSQRAVIDVLGSETDADVLSAGLETLQRLPYDPQADSKELDRAVRPLTQHTDEHVRAASHDVLSRRSDQHVTSLLDAFMSDPSDVVRSSAARGFLTQPAVSPSARNALAQVAVDTSETVAVRAAAWSALRRFPMNHALSSDYERFQLNRLADSRNN